MERLQTLLVFNALPPVKTSRGDHLQSGQEDY